MDTLDFPCYDLDACALHDDNNDGDVDFDDDADEGVEHDEDVSHGLNDEIQETEPAVDTDIAAIEAETKTIEQKTAEGENDLREKEERVQKQIDELHAIFSTGPQPHPSRTKIQQQLAKWKLKFGKHYRVAVNLLNVLGAGCHYPNVSKFACSWEAKS